MNFSNDRNQFTCRIKMRTFTENHIKQNHPNFRVSSFLFHAADAQIVVDHRVQTSNHEEFVTQINDGMCFTLERVF